MIEALKVIAILCQVSSGPNMRATVVEQARCHQYYVECTQAYFKKGKNYGQALSQCVIDKKKDVKE